MTSSGILYIATGAPKYKQHAAISAASLKRFSPDLPITLLSDTPVDDPIFDVVIPIQDLGDPFENKIAYLAQSPYERTLFLDVDTYVCSSIQELFTLLDVFDIAMALTPAGRTDTKRYQLEDVPQSFPVFNTGVIAYKASDTMTEFLARWLDEYRQMRDGWIDDQTPLRRVLYHDIKLRYSVLRPEYNCRFIHEGHFRPPVAILHGYSSQAGYRTLEQLFSSNFPDCIPGRYHGRNLLFSINAKSGNLDLLGGWNKQQVMTPQQIRMQRIKHKLFTIPRSLMRK